MSQIKADTVVTEDTAKFSAVQTGGLGVLGEFNATLSFTNLNGELVTPGESSIVMRLLQHIGNGNIHVTPEEHKLLLKLVDAAYDKVSQEDKDSPIPPAPISIALPGGALKWRFFNEFFANRAQPDTYEAPGNVFVARVPYALNDADGNYDTTYIQPSINNISDQTPPAKFDKKKLAAKIMDNAGLKHKYATPTDPGVDDYVGKQWAFWWGYANYTTDKHGNKHIVAVEDHPKTGHYYSPKRNVCAFGPKFWFFVKKEKFQFTDSNGEERWTTDTGLENGRPITQLWGISDSPWCKLSEEKRTELRAHGITPDDFHVWPECLVWDGENNMLVERPYWCHAAYPASEAKVKQNLVYAKLQIQPTTVGKFTLTTPGGTYSTQLTGNYHPLATPAVPAWLNVFFCYPDDIAFRLRVVVNGKEKVEEFRIKQPTYSQWDQDDYLIRAVDAAVKAVNATSELVTASRVIGTVSYSRGLPWLRLTARAAGQAGNNIVFENIKPRVVVYSVTGFNSSQPVLINTGYTLMGEYYWPNGGYGSSSEMYIMPVFNFTSKVYHGLGIKTDDKTYWKIFKLPSGATKEEYAANMLTLANEINADDDCPVLVSIYTWDTAATNVPPWSEDYKKYEYPCFMLESKEASVAANEISIGLAVEPAWAANAAGWYYSLDYPDGPPDKYEDILNPGGTHMQGGKNPTKQPSLYPVEQRSCHFEGGTEATYDEGDAIRLGKIVKEINENANSSVTAKLLDADKFPKIEITAVTPGSAGNRIIVSCTSQDVNWQSDTGSGRAKPGQALWLAGGKDNVRPTAEVTSAAASVVSRKLGSATITASPLKGADDCSMLVYSFGYLMDVVKNANKASLALHKGVVLKDANKVIIPTYATTSPDYFIPIGRANGSYPILAEPGATLYMTAYGTLSGDPLVMDSVPAGPEGDTYAVGVVQEIAKKSFVPKGSTVSVTVQCILLDPDTVQEPFVACTNSEDVNQARRNGLRGYCASVIGIAKTGTTNAVMGRTDGSVNLTSGTSAYRVQGTEYALGECSILHDALLMYGDGVTRLTTVGSTRSKLASYEDLFLLTCPKGTSRLTAPAFSEAVAGGYKVYDMPTNRAYTARTLQNVTITKDGFIIPDGEVIFGPNTLGYARISWKNISFGNIGYLVYGMHDGSAAGTNGMSTLKEQAVAHTITGHVTMRA